MYQGGSGLAVTGIGLTIAGQTFGLGAIIAAGAALVVVGFVVLRVAGRRKKYVA